MTVTRFLQRIPNIVCLGVLLVAGGCSGGSGQDRELELLTILGDVQDDSNAVQGRWRVAGTGEKPDPMTQEEADKINEMMSLPYLQGSREAPDVVDVTVHDPDKVYEGVNLYNSGNAPAAYAIDMDGKLLHTWQYRIEDVWPDVPATIHSTFWRRVHWYANGNILAIFEGIGMLKLDMDSNLLWSFKAGCHHQAYVLPSGSIYVLTRRAGMLPRINPERPILVDWITILDHDGSVQQEISILECFENSKYKTMLNNLRRKGDIFHANSILVLDGRAAGFFSVLKKGNIMISLLKLDAVVVIDPKQEKVMWAVSGRRNKYWKRQHDPRMLPNSDMLLFDNIGKQGKSKVIQYNIRRSTIVWQYSGTPDHPLYSRTCGLAQPLDNGNMLITESDNGRAIEITRDKEVVWEFYNPHRAGPAEELIATLFELKRVDKNFMPRLWGE